MATDVSVKLRHLIDQRGITDSALARSVDASPSQVHRWTTHPEQHKAGDSIRRPTPIQYLKLARFFGVPVEYLIDDELEEIPAVLSPDEVAVLSHYRVQRRKEGDSFTPDELAWRIQGPRFVFSDTAPKAGDHPG